MDQDLEDFKKLIVSETDEHGIVSTWVGEWAESFINEENVEDIVGLLAKQKGDASLEFWKRINSAPVCDEEWSKVIYIGSGVSGSENHQNKLREKSKHVVEIVRNTKFYQKNMNSLFRRKG